MVFYRRHLCRADPWPECVTRAFGKLTEHPEVYHVMNGPSEFQVVGVIRDWDIDVKVIVSSAKGQAQIFVRSAIPATEGLGLLADAGTAG